MEANKPALDVHKEMLAFLFCNRAVISSEKPDASYLRSAIRSVRQTDSSEIKTVGLAVFY